MKLALSMLCENPRQRTGLTTLFHEFVSRAIKLYPDISWLLFAGPSQEWTVAEPQVELVRDFQANDQLGRRLMADHFHVPVVAQAKGADALITIGFVPMRKCLPTVMHILSLQHLDRNNRVGIARSLYRRWLTTNRWQKADLIITNSNFARSQIVAACPELRDRIVQSYEGLQHEQFHPEPGLDEMARINARFGIKPGYFLWISNFYPYKQAPLLLEGYARLPEAIRTRHPLVMVGASWNGALEAARALAQSLRIATNVKFLNWIEDEWLAPLYRNARSHCLASREETFGRSVIESMACGTPCLVNDIPIMREVTDGHSLIVDFRNTQAVSAALQSIAEDDSLHAKLRKAGLKRAKQFTFEKLTTERISAIQRLLAARRSV